jgi:adenine phosphoribosyltransferase
MHGSHKKAAGTVAGENAPGPISAMGRRRQPHQQESRIPISKARQRFSPVVPVAVSAAFQLRDLFTMTTQPGTQFASNNALLEFFKFAAHGCHFLTGLSGLVNSLPVKTTIDSEAVNELKAAIRDIADFPMKGITFKDITPILRDAKLFQTAIDLLANRHQGKKIDAVVGIDARGFIFSACVALRLGAGLVPVRKKGKLPFKTEAIGYDLEYGSNILEMHIDALGKGDRVVIVDDLLATGGTAYATAGLVEKLGAQIEEIDFLIELSFLPGRAKLSKYPIYSAIQV